MVEPPQPQSQKGWNPFVAGAKGGLAGCVGCLVFIVLGLALFLLAIASCS